MGSDADEDDVNPFQREDSSPIRDIETMDIEVGNARQSHPFKTNSSSKVATERSSGLGEPEPEIIKSSDDDENSFRLSNFKNNNN